MLYNGLMLCELAVIGCSNVRCHSDVLIGLFRFACAYMALLIIWTMRMTASSIVEQMPDAIHAALHNNTGHTNAIAHGSRH